MNHEKIITDIFIYQDATPYKRTIDLVISHTLCSYQWLAASLVPQYEMMVSVGNDLL